jgi:hypothetical protein
MNEVILLPLLAPNVAYFNVQFKFKVSCIYVYGNWSIIIQFSLY